MNWCAAFTDVLIPLLGIGVALLGVVATTAVAVAAFLTSRKATRIAEAAYSFESARFEKDERRAFAAEVLEYLDEEAVVLQDPATSDEDLHYPLDLQRHARMLQNSESAEAIAWWVVDARSFIVGRANRGTEWRTALSKVLRITTSERLAHWVQRADGFDFSPFDERVLR